MKLERRPDEGQASENQPSGLASYSSSIPDSAISMGFFEGVPFDIGVDPRLQLGEPSTTAAQEFVPEYTTGTGPNNQNSLYTPSGMHPYQTPAVSAQVSPNANIDNEMPYGYFPQTPRHTPTASVSDRSSSISLARMPSLRQLRAMGAPGFNTNTPDGAAQQKSSSGEDCTAGNIQSVVEGVIKFSETMSTVQSDIAGLSLAVAEYLSWMRRVNGAGARSRSTSTDGHDTAQTPQSEAILELLEARVREVNNLAETTHRAAWNRLVTALEASDIHPSGGGRCAKNPIAAQLWAHERGMERRAAETAHFFASSYNVCLTLSDQRSSQGGRDASRR